MPLLFVRNLHYNFGVQVIGKRILEHFEFRDMFSIVLLGESVRRFILLILKAMTWIYSVRKSFIAVCIVYIGRISLSPKFEKIHMDMVSVAEMTARESMDNAKQALVK